MPRLRGWSGADAGEDDGPARARLLRALRVPPPLAEPPDPGDAPGAADQQGPGPDPPRLLVDPSRRGAAALVAVAVVATGVTTAVVWRARARPVTVPPPSVLASAGTGHADEVVVVDVQGAVRRPGLVRLPAGSRVADALAAAGGLAPGATTAGLNLARRVGDGEQVLVLPPGATPPPAAAGSGTPGSRLDLNLATLEQLDALPGVGPVTAQRILAWRSEHGRFATVDQLREIEGIGDKRFETLRELVTV